MTCNNTEFFTEAQIVNVHPNPEYLLNIPNNIFQTFDHLKNIHVNLSRHCCCDGETPPGRWCTRVLPVQRGTACWAWWAQTWCTQSPWSWPRTRTCTGTGSWGCSASAAVPWGRTPHTGAVRTHRCTGLGWPGKSTCQKYQLRANVWVSFFWNGTAIHRLWWINALWQYLF